MEIIEAILAVVGALAVFIAIIWGLAVIACWIDNIKNEWSGLKNRTNYHTDQIDHLDEKFRSLEVQVQCNSENIRTAIKTATKKKH